MLEMTILCCRIPTLSSFTIVLRKTENSSPTTIAALVHTQGPRGAHTNIGSKSSITRLILPLLGISVLVCIASHSSDHFAFRNFEKAILAGYRWLSDHYLPGDKIFMFGACKFLCSQLTRPGLLQRFLTWRLSSPCTGWDDKEGTIIQE